MKVKELINAQRTVFRAGRGGPVSESCSLEVAVGFGNSLDGVGVGVDPHQSWVSERAGAGFRGRKTDWIQGILCDWGCRSRCLSSLGSPFRTSGSLRSAHHLRPLCPSLP